MQELNDEEMWCWEKGINSLELVAFMRITEHLTGDKKYGDVADELIRKHHYGMNLLMYKRYDSWANHIDDLLGILSIMPLLEYEKNPDMSEEKKMQQPEHENSAPAASSKSAPNPTYAGVRSGSKGKVATQKAWDQTQNIAKTRKALENTDYTVTKRNWDKDKELGERRYNARLARHATGLYTEEEKLDHKPNKMSIDFSSIKDNEQAVYMAAALYGGAKKQFLSDYAKHTGQSAEALYREAEGHDGLFTTAMSSQKQMNQLGLVSLSGEDIDLDTASPDTIVQAIRDIADEEKREKAVKLFQGMTRDKDSRFYGYNAYNQDYSFRDSADDPSWI